MNLKLIGYSKNGKEIELIGVSPQIDGYQFGERLMEGVMFNINIDENGSDFSCTVEKSAQHYFKQFNKDYWYDMCKNSIKSDLERYGMSDGLSVTKEVADKFGIDTDVNLVDTSFQKVKKTIPHSVKVNTFKVGRLL